MRTLGLFFTIPPLLAACAAARSSAPPAPPSRHDDGAAPNDTTPAPSASSKANDAALADGGISACAGEDESEADDAFADCKDLRRAKGDYDVHVPRGEWLWPATCGQVSGWAGIGTFMSGFGYGFSSDSRRFAACAYPGNCSLVDLRTGWASDTGSFELSGGDDGRGPANDRAHLFHQWKVAQREGAFPYTRDLAVSWYVEPGAHVLVVTFVERSTLYERQVLRFPSGEDRSQLPVVPERAWLSPDGSVLAFQVATSQGGSGPDVGLVNVHAEAAIMLRYAAQSASAARDEKGMNDYFARAAVAERKGHRVARTLPAAQTAWSE